jgi:hypothetical protein
MLRGRTGLKWQSACGAVTSLPKCVARGPRRCHALVRRGRIRPPPRRRGKSDSSLPPAEANIRLRSDRHAETSARMQRRVSDAIESMISVCREHAGYVKRWRDGQMARSMAKCARHRPRSHRQPRSSQPPDQPRGSRAITPSQLTVSAVGPAKPGSDSQPSPEHSQPRSQRSPEHRNLHPNRTPPVSSS